MKSVGSYGQNNDSISLGRSEGCLGADEAVYISKDISSDNKADSRGQNIANSVQKVCYCKILYQEERNSVHFDCIIANGGVDDKYIS